MAFSCPIFTSLYVIYFVNLNISGTIDCVVLMHQYKTTVYCCSLDLVVFTQYEQEVETRSTELCDWMLEIFLGVLKVHGLAFQQPSNVAYTLVNV